MSRGRGRGMAEVGDDSVCFDVIFDPASVSGVIEGGANGQGTDKLVVGCWWCGRYVPLVQAMDQT